MQREAAIARQYSLIRPGIERELKNAYIILFLTISVRLSDFFVLTINRRIFEVLNIYIRFSFNLHYRIIPIHKC